MLWLTNSSEQESKTLQLHQQVCHFCSYQRSAFSTVAVSGITPSLPNDVNGTKFTKESVPPAITTFASLFKIDSYPKAIAWSRGYACS